MDALTTTAQLVWRPGDVLEVRVWGGRWFRRNLSWRGSVEATEAAARPVLERLVEHVEAMVAGAPIGPPVPPRSIQRRPNVVDGPMFDPAPLLRQGRLALDLPDGVTPMDGHTFSNRMLADLLGTTLDQVRRWRHGTQLQRDEADEAACRLGLHPVLLWPDW